MTTKELQEQLTEATATLAVHDETVDRRNPQWVNSPDRIVYLDRIKQLTQQLRAEKLASGPRIKVGGADITEHVAAMYDAIVGSMDWGSGFLCTEEVESILIVGHLVGFEVPGPDPTADSVPPELIEGLSREEIFTQRDELSKVWAAQVAAKARALKNDETAP
jgi:hypothetical protein